ncbi:hypothetical protein Q7P35_006932 [Cladosporium inversicolor]
MSVARLPQTAENGPRINSALNTWDLLLARGPPRKEPYPGCNEGRFVTVPAPATPIPYSAPISNLPPPAPINVAAVPPQRATMTLPPLTIVNVTPVPPLTGVLPLTGFLALTGGRRKDSIMGSPILEDGSPVENDFIPIDQFHRKKPHSASMENKFASPPRHSRRKARR